MTGQVQLKFLLYFFPHSIPLSPSPEISLVIIMIWACSAFILVLLMYLSINNIMLFHMLHVSCK